MHIDSKEKITILKFHPINDLVEISSIIKLNELRKLLENKKCYIVNDNYFVFKGNQETVMIPHRHYKGGCNYRVKDDGGYRYKDFEINRSEICNCINKAEYYLTK